MTYLESSVNFSKTDLKFALNEFSSDLKSEERKHLQGCFRWISSARISPPLWGDDSGSPALRERQDVTE